MDTLDGLTCSVLVRGSDPVLRDHRVHGTRILPGVSILDMIYRILHVRGIDTAQAELRRVLFRNPVAAGPDFDTELTLRFTADGGRFRVSITGTRRPSGLTEAVLDCQLHLDLPFPEQTRDLAALRARADHIVDMADLYATVRTTGIEHGDFMRARGTLHVARGELLAELSLSPQAAPYAGYFHLHPAALDSSTLLPTQFAPAGTGGPARPYIPMLIESVRARGQLGSRNLVHATPPRHAGPDGDLTTCDLDFYDDNGSVQLWLHGLTSKRIRDESAITRLDAVQPSPEPVDGVVHKLIEERVGGADFDETIGFYELGLDSTALLGVATDLEQVFGTDFSPTLLFEYNTYASLVEHLRSYGVVAGPVPEAPVSEAPTEVVWFEPYWRAAPLPSGPVPAPLLTIDARTRREWPAMLAATTANDVLWLPADPQDLAGEAVALTQFAKAAMHAGRGSLRLVCHLADDTPVAAVSGLFRTLTREHPGVRAAVVRSPRRADALAELAAGLPEVDVRYVDGTRQVRAVRPMPVPDGAARLRPHGVYLITGGLGGVGLALARHLARTVRARLVLCGRTPADPAVIAELTGLGAEVATIVMDVTSAEDVRRAVDTALARFGGLTGVVHAAAILRDGLIVGKRAEDVRAVLAPKVDGARHLEEATRHLTLDFLVLCSSTAGTWGNPGQSDYACANAFLDRFAEGRRDIVSVGWPAWAEGGMPVDAEGLRRMGLRAMDTPTAVDVLLRAVGSGRSHVVALVGDAARITAEFAPTEPAAEEATEPPAEEDGEPTAEEESGPTAEGNREPDDVDDAVAIVGISGRYPMARNLDEFWANLRSGRDCVTEVPADRWDHAAIHAESKGVPGRSYGRWGGFVDGVDEFDAVFFHISPNEAAVLDPQERLFLQEAWHAFEEAGHAPSAWRRRAVGVYVGVMYNQYQLHGVGGEPGPVPSSFSASIANRVSYFLDLRGPSVALDTMCSSSLTALHLAVDAIRRGECEAALAGGVNLAVHPNKYLLLSQSSFLSTDGRCRAFGEGGDGYVPGEGVGVVLLRPLRDAIRDGDHVHAVIRATTVNHGGRTGGFSVPNPASQAALIADSLERSALDPADLGYLEAHGTGTSLGDPIEVAALEQAFDRIGAGRGPWPLGSVKSNVGHLESAAGIAALTKVVLQLRHRELVPSLHADPLTTAVDWDRSRFRVQRDLATWKARDGVPRVAAISSFGAGGANAHVVLAEHPAPEAVPEPVRPRMFVVSAQDTTRLDQAVAELVTYLESAGGDVSAALTAVLAEVGGTADNPNEPFAELGLDYPDLAELAHRIEAVFGVRPTIDGETTPAELAVKLAATAVPVDPAALAFTLWAGRDHFDERLAVVATSTAEVVAALRTGVGSHRGRRRRTAGPVIGDDLDALAEAWVTGAEITIPPPDRPRRLSLPGYPFARDRHWVGGGRRAIHRRPELVELPDGHLFLARISRDAEDWLADHTVDGAGLVPGTFLVELALHAGGRLGHPVVVELVTEVPLPFDDTDLRLTVASPDPSGRRAFEVHARVSGGSWTRHATGALAPAGHDAAESPPLPAASEELDLTGLYQRLSGYGPAFQGLRRAWRAGDTVYADVVLPGGDAGPYALHPVLLDAALHSVAFGGFVVGDRPHLPFAWSGVRVHVPGAVSVRARVTPVRPGTVAVQLTDAAGQLVASVDSVTLRPAGAAAEPLHRVDWLPVDTADDGPPGSHVVVGPDSAGVGAALGAAGARVRRVNTLAELLDVPPVVIVPVTSGGPAAAAAHALTRDVLGQVRHWLAHDGFAAARLVFVAVNPDPATAAAWGLVRSAQSEHPGRFTLIDADDPGALARLLAGALASDEPYLSVRDGQLLAARLVRAPVTEAPEPRGLGTVLVTGGSGTLAAPVVRHLVERHGVTDVLLVSRGGRLPAGLSGLAARVEVAACDVADRHALAALLAGRSITTVVHAAGVLDDGVVTAMDARRLDVVWRPKADGAFHLHELLPDAELVLFSSLAGVLGGPGQGNYAAANAYLDALARHRVAAGGRAVSVAWGPWGLDGGMVVDRDRLGRTGIERLPVDAGLRLLDAALAGRAPDVVAVRLHPHGTAVVPPLLRGLLQAAPIEPVEHGLTQLSPTQRRARLSMLVRGQAAAVLGYGGAAAIDPDRAFQELGFDSLSSVEFRNRLGAALGLSLEATLVFDHPTPADLVEHLDGRFGGEAAPGDLPALFADFDRLAAELRRAAADDVARDRVAERVRDLLAALAPGPGPASLDAFATATDDEVFALIDAELGSPVPGQEGRNQ
ncbi:SDR family NAD(P)-dependent oxidoreductase [Micromonospora sp. NBC_01699]|uniref:SDR family NAD(P)-dependent oxidoreductase n=1 Tax=Micromonospora sp. NBC_01699 TaxID=2975984 RepID=UPI002E2FAF3D|nr:SDR family NAD(P)-dependent oxidoreductase [Micromonospora sp. NBC_01699]